VDIELRPRENRRTLAAEHAAGYEINPNRSPSADPPWAG
jgi:hypothetical protein